MIAAADILAAVDHRADKVLARAPAFEYGAGDMQSDQTEENVGKRFVHITRLGAGREGRDERQRPRLLGATQDDRAAYGDQSDRREQRDDHDRAERIVAAMALRAAGDERPQVREGCRRRDHEIGEAGMGRAEEAPDDAADDERRRHRAGPHVHVDPGRAGDEARDRGNRDGRHQQPMESAHRAIPDHRPRRRGGLARRRRK